MPYQIQPVALRREKLIRQVACVLRKWAADRQERPAEVCEAVEAALKLELPGCHVRVSQSPFGSKDGGEA